MKLNDLIVKVTNEHCPTSQEDWVSVCRDVAVRFAKQVTIDSMLDYATDMVRLSKYVDDVIEQNK